MRTVAYDSGSGLYTGCTQDSSWVGMTCGNDVAIYWLMKPAPVPRCIARGNPVDSYKDRQRIQVTLKLEPNQAPSVCWGLTATTTKQVTDRSIPTLVSLVFVACPYNCQLGFPLRCTLGQVLALRATRSLSHSHTSCHLNCYPVYNLCTTLTHCRTQPFSFLHAWSWYDRYLIYRINSCSMFPVCFVSLLVDTKTSGAVYISRCALRLVVI